MGLLRGLFDGTPGDPGGVLFRRALRVTVVGVPLFVLLGWVADRPDAAGAAVFAVFTLGSFADFSGRLGRRALRYLLAGGAGLLMLPLGTAVHGTIVPLLLVTATVTFTVFFLGALGGPFFGARFPVVIAFLFAATAPPAPGALGDRMVGWAAGTVAAAVASVVLWPTHMRFPVRRLSASACRLAGDQIRARWGPTPTDPARADELEEVMIRLRSVSLEQHLHPGAVARDERLVSEIVHQVERLVAGLVTAPPVRPRPEDSEVAPVVADMLDVAADAMSAPEPSHRAASEPGSGSVPVAHVAAALERHVEAGRDRLAAAAGIGGAGDRVAEVAESIRVRVAGRAALVVGQLVEAWRTGAEHVPATSVGVRYADDPLATLGVQLNLRSLWLRNAVRAAVALSAAMLLVALGLGGDHAFWVLLGTFSVLRADLATAGRSARAAVVGTAIGFVISVALIGVSDEASWLLWVVFPPATFLASYTSRFRPEVGAAAFTVFLVVLYTLIRPSGVAVAEARLVNVAIGAGVSVLIGAILWPRVGTVPGGALAEVVERCRGQLAAAVETRVAPPGTEVPAPPPGHPLEILTAVDRVLDMLATSAPTSLSRPTRDGVLVAVDAAVAVTAFLDLDGPAAGVADESGLRSIAGDPEAADALRADGRTADDALRRLAERVGRQGGAAHRHGMRPSSLEALAADRLARSSSVDIEATMTDVRCGATLSMVAQRADAVPGA